MPEDDSSLPEHSTTKTAGSHSNLSWVQGQEGTSRGGVPVLLPSEAEW